MSVLLKILQIVVAVVFGGAVGYIAGLGLCLVLRDSPLAWEMPLERIVLISSLTAAAGSVLFVLLEVRRIRQPRGDQHGCQSSSGLAEAPSKPDP